MEQLVNHYASGLYYNNITEASFQELLDCFGNNLVNNFENNAWNLEHITGNSE